MAIGYRKYSSAQENGGGETISQYVMKSSEDMCKFNALCISEKVQPSTFWQPLAYMSDTGNQASIMFEEIPPKGSLLIS